MCGITATVGGPAGRAESRARNPVRTGNHTAGTRVTVMELLVVLFFVLLAAASVTGLTADSRDSADWKPSADGVRSRR